MQKNDTHNIKQSKKMKSELKNWGLGLIGFGILHIVLTSVLDPVWGIIFIIIGICNFLILHRSLFLINGFVLMAAAVFHMVFMWSGSGVIGLLLIIQFVFGIFGIRKFKLYD